MKFPIFHLNAIALLHVNFFLLICLPGKLLKICTFATVTKLIKAMVIVTKN